MKKWRNASITLVEGVTSRRFKTCSFFEPRRAITASFLVAGGIENKIKINRQKKPTKAPRSFPAQSRVLNSQNIYFGQIFRMGESQEQPSNNQNLVHHATFSTPLRECEKHLW